MYVSHVCHCVADLHSWHASLTSALANTGNRLQGKRFLVLSLINRSMKFRILLFCNTCKTKRNNLTHSGNRTIDLPSISLMLYRLCYLIPCSDA